MTIKKYWDKATRFIAVRSDNPELLQAQYQSFARQMPMMYLILIANTWALAITHMAEAPIWLTMLIPTAFTVTAGTRIVFWWNVRNTCPSLEAAQAALKQTNRIAAILAIMFSAWALSLFPYGDPYAQSHVAFYMAITVISCIFCLTHLRSAALLVTGIVNGTFVAFFSSVGQPAFIAISINVALVCVVMLVILMTNYRNFEKMIIGQQQTEALSNENLRLANLDSLTNLPNRRAFFAHLLASIEAAKENGTRLALGVMDLDGFKPVNDIYGHSVGDNLLIEVGARLSTLPPNYRLYRLGGDEFAIIVMEAAEDDLLVVNSNKLLERLLVPFNLPEATVQISASMGIAVYPDIASTTEQLFDRADYALYHAKRNRRGAAVLFSAEHESRINDDSRIEQALKLANLEDELSVVFQPIINIRTQRVLGFEALARWKNPILGQTSPALFFPIAERAGLSGFLTKHLLRHALVVAKNWHNDIRLSFNLSVHDLNSHDGVLALMGIIEGSGFDARRLDLEITETAFMHDFEQMKRSIEMLSLLGCGISLDDFGTGYSNLSRLHSLPLTKIKIDQSFVTNLHKKPASYKIVKSLLALGHDMELDCIIEGVETKEELAALEKLGGTIIQGYVFSPPMSEQDLEGFLSGNPTVFNGSYL
ncbi:MULTISPECIES: EAL domain-containing protein [unclassified Martelella]|uniref:putative bifunctional diguanylate cyclase/phosphodiesterase n=1 Tax=unclassified Martelella TaxID=2629616 RepID=UPI0025C45AED|nr:EAL domain-containing protein [Martelella sp.]|tara:strand:- start:832 stop:2784 length:1953 start_codon:yes stop_codon:yes gene_type:complete